MQRLTQATGLVIAGCILVALTGLLWYGSVPGLLVSDRDHPSVSLLYASTGSMPQLLNTGQIDAFLIWEPVVSNAELSGIGKRVAAPADLPPPGKWDNAAINVLVMRKDLIARHPTEAALLSALTTAAINRTQEDPNLAENITAAWVYGNGSILTPSGSLQPIDVERHAFANIVFTSGASPPESGIVKDLVTTMGGTAYDPASMVNASVFQSGQQYLAGSPLPVPSATIPSISIGYIPSTDNYAPLYVMVKDSAYFCNHYNFCLVPDDPDAARPVSCTLLVNGTPAAHVDLIPGQSGGGIMTTIGQNALDGAFVGSIPAEQQIGLGNPAFIIESINTGGSGLVVSPSAPCTDWPGFVRWAKIRSAGGRPLVVATVQSSIQEDMVKEACSYENITVKLYGTDYTTDSA
jgi:ABC-type nitrate/sulfonate/bicarbonate transport system substrate-binding protein